MCTLAFQAEHKIVTSNDDKGYHCHKTIIAITGRPLLSTTITFRSLFILFAVAETDKQSALKLCALEIGCGTPNSHIQGQFKAQVL